MLSMFPELYDLSFYAPFLLRITVGFFIVYQSSKLYFGIVSQNTTERMYYRILASIMFVVGVLIIAGAWLQLVAAIGTALCIMGVVLKKRFPKIFIESRSFYLLSACVTLSLIVLGPGMWAVDLPL